MTTGGKQYGHLQVDARCDPASQAHIFTDDPLDLRAVVEELARHIGDARKPTADGQKRNGKIGLFGGQGQGKTTTLNAALALHKRRLAGPDKPPLDTWRYDAAKAPPDQVEWEFDRWVLQQFLFGALRAWWLPLIIGAGLLLTVIGMAAHALEILNIAAIGLLTPSLTIAAATFGKFRPFLVWAARSVRELESRCNFALGKLSNSLIVVDNLDRASIAQQRAVLRTLDKHRDDLGVPFVVVMDDTALRTGSNDPEPPSELFRKVVEVEIQMPPRGIVQTARIVGTLADELALADKLWAGRRLRGDLVRLFTLLPSPVSPRTIARFLNDLSSRCRQHGLSQAGDVAAMARVLAVGQVLPSLRADQHRMVGALAANDIGQLGRLWDSLTGGGRGPLPVDASRLFHLTRHLLPRNGDWQRVLASVDRPEAVKPETNSGSEDPPAPPSAPPERLPDRGQLVRPLARLLAKPLAKRQLVRRLSEVLPRVMDGFGSWDWRSPRADDALELLQLSADVADETLTDEHVRYLFQFFAGEADDAFTPDGAPELPQLSVDEIADTVWPVIEAFLSAANSPTERLRVFDYVRETLGETLGTDLLRVRLGDAEALAAMHPSARAALLQSAVESSGNQALLLAVPPDYLSFHDRILIVTHAGLGAPDRHSVAPWLGEQGAGAEPLNLVRPSSMRSPSAVVEAGWPPFQGEELSIKDQAVRDELTWHFDTLKILHDRMIPVFPASLAQALLGRKWLYYQSIKHPLIVLKALSTLVTCGGAAGSYPHGVIGAWNDNVLKVLAVGRESVFRDIAQRVARPNIIVQSVRQPIVWFALFLTITFVEDSEREALCQEWWGALANGAGPVCLDPWFMEFLLRSSALPVEDADIIGARVIDALFGKALAGFDLPVPNLDIEEQIVAPLRAKLKHRTDVANWL